MSSARAARDLTSLHLAVDASRLLSDRRGMGRYVRNVLRALWTDQPTLVTTLYVRQARDIAATNEWLRATVPETLPLPAVEPLSALQQTTAHVVWYPWNFVTQRAADVPAVVTIHDVAPMLALDHRWWKVLARWRMGRRYRRAATTARHLLTVSHFSREEITRHLGVPASQITVTPLAADDLSVDVPDDAAILARVPYPAPYFLTVGGRDGRKNLALLDAALEHLWLSGVRVPLVQCGPWRARSATSDRPWLLEVGYVSDAQLVTLYRHATALVFPSRYEGFGLPVVEAMRSGCAVIAAEGSSLTEVCGGAATLVPWHDADALADAMRRLLNDAPYRLDRRDAGRRRAAELSWRETARQTYDVLRAAARQ